MNTREAGEAVHVMHQYRELSEKIIGCAFRVYNRMGYGFVESVYERCLLIELRRAGLRAEAQCPVQVQYEGEVVGDFVVDVLVESVLLLELKSVRALTQAHEVQLVNYLVATDLPIGLLLNFGPEGVEMKRKVKVLPRTVPQRADHPSTGST